ncbi:MAG: Fic family protein [Candidatus Woesearchaeota archaeon]
MVTDTITSLEKVLNRIRAHEEFDSTIVSQSCNCLRKDALGHSLRIEGIGNNIKNGFDLPKEVRTKFDYYMSQILEGREYLLKDGISVYTLSQLGRIVEPKNHIVGNFRKKEVMYGGFEGSPPSQIYYDVDNVLYRAQNLQEFHPVLRGLDLHVSLIQIHPYLDGNGRSARLVQDVFLEMNQYPSPIIKESEREFYIRLMENVISERIRGHSLSDIGNAEKYFQEYMVSRILESALEIEKSVGKQRNFTVLLDEKVDNGSVKSISTMLRKKLKSQGKCAKVKSVKQSGGGFSLQIVGEVPYVEIKKYLEQVCGKKGTNFELNRK